MYKWLMIFSMISALQAYAQDTDIACSKVGLRDLAQAMKLYMQAEQNETLSVEEKKEITVTFLRMALRTAHCLVEEEFLQEDRNKIYALVLGQRLNHLVKSAVASSSLLYLLEGSEELVQDVFVILEKLQRLDQQILLDFINNFTEGRVS